MALHDGQILEVLWHSVGFQDGHDDGEVAVGALDGQHRGGVEVGQAAQLAVHGLIHIISGQVDRLAAEGDLLRHLGRGDPAVVLSGLFGVLRLDGEAGRQADQSGREEAGRELFRSHSLSYAY